MTHVNPKMKILDIKLSSVLIQFFYLIGHSFISDHFLCTTLPYTDSVIHV